MKYITTNKHPELKEGIEIIFDEHDSKWKTQTGLFRLNDMQKDAELKRGYIKEVEEKEFTKSDVLNFGFLCLGKIDPEKLTIIGLDKEIALTFDYWLKKDKQAL